MLDVDGRPLHLRWDYTRAEIIADGVVHALGLALGVAGTITIVVLTLNSTHDVKIASALLYTGALLSVLTISAAYNLWPVSPWKWRLRKFDHSAIYLLIAGTYTPFLLQTPMNWSSVALLVWVWTVSCIGIALKLLLPGRFDRTSIGLYLLLGWSGLAAYDSVVAGLPSFTLQLLAAGGILYTVGVVFHAWRGLRFQNVVWHAFVLVAMACHYVAVLETVAHPGS